MNNPPERNNENPFFCKTDEKIRENSYETQNMIVTNIAELEETLERRKTFMDFPLSGTTQIRPGECCAICDGGHDWHLIMAGSFARDSSAVV